MTKHICPKLEEILLQTCIEEAVSFGVTQTHIKYELMCKFLSWFATPNIKGNFCKSPGGMYRLYKKYLANILLAAHFTNKIPKEFGKLKRDKLKKWTWVLSL